MPKSHTAEVLCRTTTDPSKPSRTAASLGQSRQIHPRCSENQQSFPHGARSQNAIYTASDSSKQMALRHDVCMQTCRSLRPPASSSHTSPPSEERAAVSLSGRALCGRIRQTSVHLRPTQLTCLAETPEKPPRPAISPVSGVETSLWLLVPSCTLLGGRK